MTAGWGTPEAITHTFGYDATGQISTVDVLEGPSQTPRRLATNSYDPAGNLVSSQDAAGRTWKATYDGYGRPLTVTDPVGVVTTWSYDATTEELLAVCTPLGTLPAAGQTITCDTAGVTASRTTFDYDPAKRGDVTQVKDPTRQDANPDNADRFVYGTGGQVEEHRNPANNLTTFDYDTIGRLEALVTPSGHVSPNQPGDFTWLIDTDDAGRVTKVTDPLGHYTERGFAPDGQVDWERDANANLTDYAFNAGGELTGVTTGPTGAPVMSSSTDYRADGRVAIHRDGAGAETVYDYTAAGLPKSVEIPTAASPSTAMTAPGGWCPNKPPAAPAPPSSALVAPATATT